jgi:hypothetical protein
VGDSRANADFHALGFGGRQTQRQRVLDGLGEFGFQFGADLRQQIVIEKPRDFGTLGIHHAVDAKVEVGLVEHEQLGEEVFEFIQIGHGVGGAGGGLTGVPVSNKSR